MDTRLGSRTAARSCLAAALAVAALVGCSDAGPTPPLYRFTLVASAASPPNTHGIAARCSLNVSGELDTIGTAGELMGPATAHYSSRDSSTGLGGGGITTFGDTTVYAWVDPLPGDSQFQVTLALTGPTPLDAYIVGPLTADGSLPATLTTPWNCYVYQGPQPGGGNWSVAVEGSWTGTFTMMRP